MLEILPIQSGTGMLLEAQLSSHDFLQCPTCIKANGGRFERLGENGKGARWRGEYRISAMTPAPSMESRDHPGLTLSDTGSNIDISPIPPGLLPS